MSEQQSTAQCATCHRRVQLDAEGRMKNHNVPPGVGRGRCVDSGAYPRRTTVR